MFCRQQLADFQASFAAFQSEGISILAASVDSLDKANEIMEKAGVTYPVAYGLNTEEVSNTIGAYFEPEKKFLHAAGFIIAPDRKVSLGCYSNGAIGRLTAKDSLALIRYFKKSG
ncbi:AhpC/TSA family protein [Desulfonatronum thiosulfatophilum]|uniref:AhpC/TSA family protein n=1 Tax=Desulfonatronum thiosulfatophilum TaxID=617002 RepID=A0A1G6AKC1_9BACT|nr:redoxin domain-containing protein [Desulfonatronum thiosulfatophilum]SDB08852.1 AhpC/TSA family protein [Desulfonatronum thiosulfatophilum]